MALQELPADVLSRDECLTARFRMADHYPHVIALADHAFRWAAKEDSEDLMRYVLEYGAPVDINALLCSAEVKDNPDAITLLKAKRAATDPLYSFTNPLHTACFYGQLGYVDTLLNGLPSMKWVLRSEDHRGRTALHQAVGGRGEEVDGERQELIYMLLSLGADPIVRDMNGQTALLLAKAWRCDEIITTLKEAIKRNLESPLTPEEAFPRFEPLDIPADTRQFSSTDHEVSSLKREVSYVEETRRRLAYNVKEVGERKRSKWRSLFVGKPRRG